MERRLKRDPYKLVGTIIGRYKILELAGMGGMGVVYRAQHMVTRGEVALKLLKPDLAIANPEMIKLFLEEASKTVALTHPYIIKVTDADLISEAIADSTAFLVMEWLDGATVEEELKEHGAMSLDRVAPLVEQVCEAVGHAHSKGIVHRDLKPSNIMLVRDYRNEEAVKIVDFGIAKALTSTVGANSRVMGAPYYASPEQLIVGSAIDHRSDIYSLGVLCYQMLTGRLPFDATSVDMMIRQTISVPPPPMHEIRADIPAAVEEVVFRALAKRPQDRYQSVGEFARAIRQANAVETGDLSVECLDAITGQALAGASVYLNGRHIGETDEAGLLSRRNLLPGEHLVEIESLQRLPWQGRVRVGSREATHLTAGLALRELGDLIVSASVPGADVLLNGAKVGTTDEAGMLYLKDLALGKVLVEVKYYKRFSSAREAVIIPGQQSHLNVELPPAPRRDYLKRALRKASSLLSAPFSAARRVHWASTAPDTRPHRGRLPLYLLAGAGVLTLLVATSLAVVLAYVYLWRPPDEDAMKRPVLATPTPTPTPPAPARSLTADPLGVLATGCNLCKVAAGSDEGLIASTGADNVISVWRAGEQAPFMRLRVPTPPGSSVAVSPDGSLIAAGDDAGSILVWQADGRPLKTLKAEDYVWDLRFSPDGRSLVSTEGRKPSTVRVWRASDWSEERTLPLAESAVVFAVSHDGSTLALLGENGRGVRLWSVAGDSLLRQVGGENGKVMSCAFSPNGGLLAVGYNDGAVRLWRVGDGGLAAELQVEEGDAGDIAFSADGRTVTAGMAGGAIRVWDVGDGSALATLEGHTKIVLSLAFSSDGRLLASGGDGEAVRLWRLSENQR